MMAPKFSCRLISRFGLRHAGLVLQSMTTPEKHNHALLLPKQLNGIWFWGTYLDYELRLRAQARIGEIVIVLEVFLYTNTPGTPG